MALKGSSFPSITAVMKEIWPKVAKTAMPSLGASWLSPVSRPLSPPMAKLERIGHTKADIVKTSLGAEPRKIIPSYAPALVRKHVPFPFNIRSPIPNMSKGALLASNVMEQFPSQHAILRPLSTLATCRASLSSIHLLTMTFAQRRYFRDVSRKTLAYAEETANKNPKSATAQNFFYDALLRANMPAIVIERYRTGLFATNAAVEEAYQKALAMLGVGSAQQGDGKAVGAAGGSNTNGFVATYASPGAQAGPVQILVKESPPSIWWKGFKLVVILFAVAYIVAVVFSAFVEAIVASKPRLGFGAGSAGKNMGEIKAEAQKTKFADVHGCDEAKEELQELVDFLRDPDKFSNLGGKLPKGFLLAGPPGTGKTLLARAVAGEAGVPFFYMSGSEFDEIYVGVGAKRVRTLFAAAKARSPAIIFIDELDAVGMKRSSGGAQYNRQTLNQLLTELDGFEQNSGVVVIGATNFAQSLDKALTRPGRFDRHVAVDLPDARGRMAILQHHARDVKVAPEVDFQAIAATTSGLSGAELESIVNQAAIHASKNKAAKVTLPDFDWAKDKVIMGAEKRHMVISAHEKEMTAYHEAGHALMTLLNKDSMRQLYKVTILARGFSLGHTAFLPDTDRHSQTGQNLLSVIDSSLAGKLAEEIVYGSDNTTTGVVGDIETATSLAFEMVGRYGMSPKMGHVEYLSRYKHLSSELKAQIESEVTRIINESYERCRRTLTEHRKELDLLAAALVEYETLDRAEVEKVIRGEKLVGRISIPPGPMVVPIPEEPPYAGDRGTDTSRPNTGVVVPQEAGPNRR